MHLCFLFKSRAENLANKTDLFIVPFNLPYLWICKNSHINKYINYVHTYVHVRKYT